ncbi:LacI family DNA-binding transcriptional regulator [Actinoplanes utahensis]|uniref:LacI family transcriptional regulator n=1 Tax=Actinoplanes utahensis TaxID=1869 RepID=A0A0A6ULG7_ACTUT|nr:LacI family DNA-binding transcriptional regulator [Actinoplanes utahensis]KHD76975.1 LacI family transcriptional regulator [Actinoplanes utahensis]GIF27233.1 LacI family transcriptional regulator [Actinoplanes utahensis]
MARIEDVAARAGVSVGTVSNVLNRPQAVAVKTRDRVLAAIAALDYRPNEAARSLAAGRSRTVGLIVPDVTNPFFADVARGAEQVADRRDVVVMLHNSGESAEREQRYLGRAETQRVQGVLVSPVHRAGTAVDELVRRGTPVVLLDRGAGRHGLCCVSVDDQAGGRLAARHLAERGHRRLAYVGGPLSVPQAAARLAGARQSTGATIEVVETAAVSVTEGRAAGTAIADRSPADRPEAVFCANDLLALGVLQAVTRRGLRVPADLAIVGYDDIDYAAAAAVPLTSVRQPRAELGRIAAELLFEEIDSPRLPGEIDSPRQHRHRQVVFQPDLVVRQSSGGDQRG